MSDAASADGVGFRSAAVAQEPPGVIVLIRIWDPARAVR
jgi:hypothetical protein